MECGDEDAVAAGTPLPSECRCYLGSPSLWGTVVTALGHRTPTRTHNLS